MSFAEAERQERLARERIDIDLLRACGHLNAAWDATDEAALTGASLQQLGELRLRLLKFGMCEWIPRATAHAKTIRDDSERGEWYRGICGAIRSGLGWYEREATAGNIGGVNLEDVRSAWAPLLEGFELAISATRA